MRKSRSWYADRMDKFAVRYVNRESREFPDEPDMLKMFRDDGKRFNRIAEHIRNGKFKLAIRLIENTDTAPREEIPGYIWDWVDRQIPRERWFVPDLAAIELDKIRNR